ncbi:MAG: NAD(P)-binding domain-containing protein [Pseudomonadota bacterium]
MQVAIIGTGNVGSALARALKSTDHQVTLGAREPGKVAALAAETGARATTQAAAAQAAEIVILALPWHAAQDAIAALGDLTGKTVIDCMNPLGMVDGALGLTMGHDTSGGEQVASWLPAAHVVKTLNQTGAEVMADTARLAHPPVMFLAGDNDAAKARVTTLLTDLGFQPRDAGDLTKARLLEPFAMVWINQAIQRGQGRDWAFAAVGPSS